jgi:hypothetical protein
VLKKEQTAVKKKISAVNFFHPFPSISSIFFLSHGNPPPSSLSQVQPPPPTAILTRRHHHRKMRMGENSVDLETRIVFEMPTGYRFMALHQSLGLIIHRVRDAHKLWIVRILQ